MVCGLTDSVAFSSGVHNNSGHRNTKGLCVRHSCSIGECKQRAVSLDILYCESHICRECYSLGTVSGADEVCPGSQLCRRHRCDHADTVCTRASLEGVSPFCAKHSCKECIRMGIFADSLCVDTYPRNFCSQHPLCNNTSDRGKLCTNLALDDGTCELHRFSELEREKFICCGTTKKLKSCTNKATVLRGGGKRYCHGHANQGCDIDSDDSDDESDSGDEEPVPRQFLKQPVLGVTRCLVRCQQHGCKVLAFCEGAETGWRCPLHGLSAPRPPPAKHAEEPTPAPLPAPPDIRRREEEQKAAEVALPVAVAVEAFDLPG